MIDRRTFLKAGAATMASMSLPGIALAQGAKPITVVVGFAPGGAPDIVARVLAEKLRDKLQRTVIVENKSGAGGQLALSALQIGPTDGSLYALTPPGMLTIYPSIYKKLPYSIKDLIPVVSACTFEHGLVVGPALNAKTFNEYTTIVKADSDKRFYGIPALGTAPHFVGDILSQAIGTKLSAVAYRGGPPMIQDLIGGQIPMAINVLSNFVEFHRSGKMRVLATTGSKRSPLLPDVPTLTDLGYKQAEAEEWFAFFAKAGTPNEEVRKFEAAVRAVLDMPDVREKLLAAGFYASAQGPAELGANIRTNSERWAQVVKATGFKAEI